MPGSVTDSDGLVFFCHILDGNTADCEYNNLVLSALQSVYGDEFGDYTYIADCKILMEKNLKLNYKGRNPVKINSCLPDNFGGKLSEKIRKNAYDENEWESLGICATIRMRKTLNQSTGLELIKKMCGHPMLVHVYRKKKRKSILRGI